MSETTDEEEDGGKGAGARKKRERELPPGSVVLPSGRVIPRVAKTWVTSADGAKLKAPTPDSKNKMYPKERVRITLEDCACFLADAPRILDDARSAYFAQEFTEKRMRRTPEPIYFSEKKQRADGTVRRALLNGQHRLAGQMLAGVKVFEYVVWYDVPDDYRTIGDQTKNWNAGDQFTFCGGNSKRRKSLTKVMRIHLVGFEGRQVNENFIGQQTQAYEGVLSPLLDHVRQNQITGAPSALVTALFDASRALGAKAALAIAERYGAEQWEKIQPLHRFCIWYSQVTKKDGNAVRERMKAIEAYKRATYAVRATIGDENPQKLLEADEIIGARPNEVVFVPFRDRERRKLKESRSRSHASV